jgi:creatinine amidohydrolase
MRPYILAETNWKTIRNQEIDLAILPWGATEAHNLHLPFSTDNIESEYISLQAATQAWEKGAKIIVLPNIPFGVNTGQMDIRLNINLNPSTQAAILRDIIEALNNHKIYKLLILNSHGGNDFKQIIRELGVKFPKMFVCTCNWYQAVNKNDFFENEGDHADEMETSIIQYIAPQMMLPVEEAGNGEYKKFKINAFNEKWAWAERKWSQVTSDTGIGNPKKATPQKGEKYLEAVILKISELMIELSNADINNLYD